MEREGCILGMGTHSQAYMSVTLPTFQLEIAPWVEFATRQPAPVPVYQAQVELSQLQYVWPPDVDQSVSHAPTHPSSAVCSAFRFVGWNAAKASGSHSAASRSVAATSSMTAETVVALRSASATPCCRTHSAVSRMMRMLATCTARAAGRWLVPPAALARGPRVSRGVSVGLQVEGAAAMAYAAGIAVVFL